MKRERALKTLIDRTGVPVTQRIVRADNIKTHYLTAGSGEPLVLLHGGGGGAVLWHTLMGPLSAFFDVIAPDVVGYGESDKPSAPYDRPYFATWLKNFLDAIGLKKTTLIGFSQGGAIALQFAHDYPERVDKLVLIDSAGFTTRIPFGALAGFVLMNTIPSQTVFRWLSRYLLYDNARIDEAWAHYSIGVCTMPGGKRALWNGKGKAIDPVPHDILKRIQHPALMVWGEKEKLFPLADAEHAARHTLPDARLHVIPKAGHETVFDQPEAVLDALTSFLKK